jgi:hypothetical protein
MQENEKYRAEIVKT